MGLWPIGARSAAAGSHLTSAVCECILTPCMAATSTRTLSTAEQRREDVLTAGARAFAARGYHGTPTTEIAKAAGISQAYLFRLFPTKLELFVALTERCFDHTAAVFTEAASAARGNGADVLTSMGRAYAELLADRDQLLLQMQAYAASDETAIRDATRDGFRRLVELVQRESGADDATVRSWFGHGMLMNVLAAMGVYELDEPWANVMKPDDNGPC
jgi:AcrR family transcriptional regulator